LRGLLSPAGIASVPVWPSETPCRLRLESCARIYVADHLRRGQLMAVLEDWSAAETSVYALYPSKRHMTAKINAFLALIAEQLVP
jgi:DNA-binding transcriptional LysR family regulator